MQTETKYYRQGKSCRCPSKAIKGPVDLEKVKCGRVQISDFRRCLQLTKGKRPKNN